MNIDEAAERINAILSLGLDQLTEQGGLATCPSDSFVNLSLPDSEQLLLFGLPSVVDDEYLRVYAEFQEGSASSLGDGLFKIANCNAAKIGVKISNGKVFAVAKHKEFPPQLQSLHPDWSPITNINSSLSSFVDFSWRWYWIVSILSEQEDLASREAVEAWSSAPSGAEQSNLPDFFAPIRNLADSVLKEFERRDPDMPRGYEAFWRSLLISS